MQDTVFCKTARATRKRCTLCESPSGLLYVYVMRQLTWPRDPVRPITFITMASLTG